MDIGLYLNPQDASDRTAAEVWNDCLELAWTADRVGFNHLSTGQHYLSDFTQLQLLPFLSRLTGEVHEMESSTGIILLPLRPLLTSPNGLLRSILSITATSSSVLGLAIGISS